MNEDLNVQKERFRSTYKRMAEMSEETAKMIIDEIDGMTREGFSSSVNLLNILTYAGLIPKKGHMPLVHEDEVKIQTALNDKFATFFSHYKQRPMIWIDRTPPNNPSSYSMNLNVDFGELDGDLKVSQECLDLANKLMGIYLNMIGADTVNMMLRMNFKSVPYAYTKSVTDFSDAKRFLTRIVSQFPA